MEVTTPTELRQLLDKNRPALGIYRKLSDSAKRSYATYIMAAETVRQRQCRAKHAVKMLMGQAANMDARC